MVREERKGDSLSLSRTLGFANASVHAKCDRLRNGLSWMQFPQQSKSPVGGLSVAGSPMDMDLHTP